MATVQATTPWNRVIAVTQEAAACELLAGRTHSEVALTLTPHRDWSVRPQLSTGQPLSEGSLVLFQDATKTGWRNRAWGRRVDAVGVARLGPIALCVDPREVRPALVATAVGYGPVPPELRQSVDGLALEVMDLSIPDGWAFNPSFIDTLEPWSTPPKEDAVPSQSSSVAASSIEPRRVGTVFGELWLDTDVPRSWLHVRLEAPTGEAALAWKRGAFEGDDAHELDRAPADRFGGAHVPPGTYHLCVLLRGWTLEETELHRVPRLVVEADSFVELAPIDLRGKIQVARAQVVDRMGRPQARGWMDCPARRWSLPWAAVDDAEWVDHAAYRGLEGGEVLVCALNEWPTLRILTPGCRRRSFTFPGPGVHTIEMPPALQVTLRLPPDVDAPPAPSALRLTMTSGAWRTGASFGSRSEHRPTGDRGTFDASGRCRLALPFSGEYEMHLELVEEGWDGASRVSLTHRHVAVVDADEVQELELPINAQALEDVVRRWASERRR